MVIKKEQLLQSYKSNQNALYKGKPVTVITVFLDIDTAMIEDEDGNVFDVKNSLIRISNS